MAWAFSVCLGSGPAATPAGTRAGSVHAWARLGAGRIGPGPRRVRGRAAPVASLQGGPACDRWAARERVTLGSAGGSRRQPEQGSARQDRDGRRPSTAAVSVGAAPAALRQGRVRALDEVTHQGVVRKVVVGEPGGLDEEILELESAAGTRSRSHSSTTRAQPPRAPTRSPGRSSPFCSNPSRTAAANWPTHGARRPTPSSCGWPSCGSAPSSASSSPCKTPGPPVRPLTHPEVRGGSKGLPAPPRRAQLRAARHGIERGTDFDARGTPGAPRRRKRSRRLSFPGESCHA